LNLTVFLRRNISLSVLFSVLSMSLAWNVLLLWKAQANTTVATPGARLDLAVDTVIPPLSTLRLDGQPHQVRFGGPLPTILYVLSPTCTWCDRNYDNIVAIGRAKKQDFSFVGLSTGHDLEVLKRYNQTNPLPFDVFLIESDDLVRSVGLAVTPQTALLDTGGRVQRVWSGAMFAQQKDDAERFFGLALPGLRGIPRS